MMPYEVTVEARVTKQLRRLPRDVSEDLYQALTGLAENPRPRGCRKVRGKNDVWRIVVRRDYRVLYRVLDETKQVAVFDVDRREKDTYNQAVKE